MNLSTALINGVLMLVQKMNYKNKENVARIYDPADSRVPKAILFESKTKPGVYLDELTGQMYKDINGKWACI